MNQMLEQVLPHFVMTPNTSLKTERVAERYSCMCVTEQMYVIMPIGVSSMNVAVERGLIRKHLVQCSWPQCAGASECESPMNCVCLHLRDSESHTAVLELPLGN
jgi:hypothetical protein